MEKKKLLLSGILGVLLIGIIGGTYYFNHQKQDNIRFTKEYTEVKKDNVFVYRTIEETNKILENGTGLIYIGFPECPWCQKYVTFIDEVAHENEIEKIYYLNVLNDRKENTTEYQKLVKLLDKNLQFDDEGNRRVYVPAVIAVKDGKIVGYDHESSLDTGGLKDPNEYWTEEKTTNIKKKLTKFMNDVNDNKCTDCNKD